MANTPATNKQVPDHAILDYYNKQVYLGNQFILDTGVVTFTGTTEVPFIYMANPAVSTAAAPNYVSLFNKLQRLFCNDIAGLTGVVYKIYINPTGVSGGSAITPYNNRIASTNSSVATILKSPTVVSNGTNIATFTVGYTAPLVDTNMLIIDPGKSILITAKPTATTTGTGLLSWYEI